jgi:tetratricopeptide (TPR) repeat protein
VISRTIALVALCAGLYANSLQGEFHYDDFHSLVDNPHVRSVANVGRFFLDPDMFSADPAKSMYRPLLLCTYAFNYALGQYDVLGYHLFNIALHALASVLVATLATRLVGGLSAGWIAGLFFALHPLATEPVNYISSRSESLAACFYLVVIVWHLRKTESSRFAWGKYLAYGAGLLSKSIALSAPVSLWLLDRVQGRARAGRSYGVFAVVAGAYLGVVYANRFLGDSLSVPVRSGAVQLWTQLKAPAYYLYMLFVPVRLNVQHQFSESSHAGEAAVLLGGALVASLAFLAWRGRRTLLGWSLLWAGIALLPTLVIPLNMLVNERRLYLPLAALALVLAWLGRRPWPKEIAFAVAVCFAALTWQRNEVWRSELNLWQDAVAKAPLMHAAQNNWGKAQQQAGRWQEALAAYERAMFLDARHGDAFNNAATIYHLRGEKLLADGQQQQAQKLFLLAVDRYKKAQQLYPTYAEIAQNLAAAYVNLEDLPAAIREYERALAIDSTRGDTWSNYGQALYKDGRLDEATGAFTKAIERLPSQAEPYNNLGNIYADRSDYAASIYWYQQALEREPEQRDAVLVNLLSAYRAAGQYGRARQLIGQRLGRAAGRAEWLYQLGLVERAAGDGKAAVAALVAAAQEDSSHYRACAQAGEVLYEQGRYREAAAQFFAAIRVNKSYSRAWYGLGRTQRILGDRSAALEALRQFLHHWPQRDERALEAGRWIEELERVE